MYVCSSTYTVLTRTIIIIIPLVAVHQLFGDETLHCKISHHKLSIHFPIFFMPLRKLPFPFVQKLLEQLLVGNFISGLKAVLVYIV